MGRDKKTKRIRTNNTESQDSESVIVEYTETGEGVSLYPLNDNKHENIDGKQLITEKI